MMMNDDGDDGDDGVDSNDNSVHVDYLIMNRLTVATLVYNYHCCHRHYYDDHIIRCI